ncbi:MAG: winged helix-turn-helix domain-containing protein [Alphaproteobacteria bacterium]|nr:winged helix-turn-helix domain-containing protein [Alphaproteobacteria bacterium]
MPTEHPALRIEQFDPARHDRADFDCGVGRLNTEYELLRVLSSRPGRVWTYEELLREVWRGENGDQARARAIVKKLRRKLGDTTPGRGWVLNERGVGYRVPRPDERRAPRAPRREPHPGHAPDNDPL